MAEPGTLTETGGRLYEQLAPTFFKTDSAHGWAGWYFVSALAAMLDPAAEIVQINETLNLPPFAILFTPSLVPAAWLPWLGQFVGISSELMERTIASGQTALARTWISNPLNYLRGTVEGIELIAKSTLTGSKTVTVYPMYGGEPFQLFVATNASETPSELATLTAILSMVPAWVNLTYVTVTGGEYLTLEAAHATYALTEAAHTTYKDVELEPAK